MRAGIPPGHGRQAWLQGCSQQKLVLIGLGTNGYLEKSTITQTIKELKGREIYWINNNVDRDWESNNELIAEAAKKYKNVHMIDWKGRVRGP